ncbi:MAG: hypothetical protein Q9160_001358 [Pyrenula sp. 1 TL-2023]
MSVHAGSCTDDSNLIPIKELMQSDKDVNIIFLSANGIRYNGPVDDLWYAAHQTTNDTIRDVLFSGAQKYYLSDEAASVLGCTEQYQICNPTVPPQQGCSPLDGGPQTGLSSPTSATDREKATNWGFEVYSITALLQTLQSTALTARLSFSEGSQAQLPADQWQKEVEYWHYIWLASLQATVVDTAVGPQNPDILKEFWAKPENHVERYLCKNQKIVSTAYTNFSTMWLIIVLLVGTSIILLEQSVETIVGWLERRKMIKTSTAEWFGNGTLQLQRLAHEELGFGDWEGCGGKAIPITQKGQLLGVFITADKEHLKLSDPNTVVQKAESATKIENSGDQDGGVGGNITGVSEQPTNAPSQDGSCDGGDDETTSSHSNGIHGRLPSISQGDSDTITGNAPPEHHGNDWLEDDSMDITGHTPIEHHNNRRSESITADSPHNQIALPPDPPEQ